MLSDLLKISSYLMIAMLFSLSVVGCSPHSESTGVSMDMVVAEPVLGNMLAEKMPIDLTAPLQVKGGCGLNEDDPAYRLGPNDVLDIRVFGENDLSGRYTITEAGAISMPLVGEIGVSACTLSEATQNIRDKYEDGYLIDPSITVEIYQYRPFYIIGEVRNPGRYDYSLEMDMLKAVALAGGFTYRANRKNAEIYRKSLSGQKIYQTKTVETDIQPGDVIVVKERFF